MKILLITQDFPPEIGGIQTYAYELAKRLRPMCKDLAVVAPQKKEAASIDDPLDFKVHRITSSNTLIGILSIPRVLSTLRKNKMDIAFHAQWQTLLVSVIAKKLGFINFIAVAVHGREFFFNPFGHSTFLGKMYEKYKKYLVSKADYFFPVSSFSNQVLEEQTGVPKDKSTVVINGTNPNVFYPKETSLLKEKYGYQGKKVISTMSRLIELKGVDTVLRAIPYLIDSIPNLMYVIVGDGVYKPTLVQIVEELNISDYVHFVGKVPYKDIVDYHNLSDIYVMPSKYMKPIAECFGIVFLEANACEKPTIGANTGGISDAVIDGKTGLLVEEQNPKALAEAIQKLLLDDALREKMGKAGRQRVLEEANWDVAAQRIYDVLEQQIKDLP